MKDEIEKNLIDYGFVDKIINEVKKNELGVPDIIDVSIDKASIMGDFIKGGAERFQDLIDVSNDVEIKKGDGKYSGYGFIKKKIYFQWIDTNIMKNARSFRLEFNPNKIREEEKKYLKENVLPLLKNVGFTRLDVAFDVAGDLSDYIFIQKGAPKKQKFFIGTLGKVETFELGSQNSSLMFTVYNKRIQLKKQIDKFNNKAKEYFNDVIDGIKKNEINKPYHVKEEEIKKINFETDVLGQVMRFRMLDNYYIQDLMDDCKLTINDVKKYYNFTQWWRFEVEVKEEKINHFKKFNDEILKGVYFFKPFYESCEKLNERAVLFLLINNPNEWGKMDRKTKKKYKDLMEKHKQFDLVDYIKEEFDFSFLKIKEELNDFISSSSNLIFQKNLIE